MVDILAPAMFDATASADYGALAFGVFAGLSCGLFVAIFWLRIFRWIFALMGLRA